MTSTLELLETFSGNNCENTSGSLSKGGQRRFTFVYNTISNSPKVRRAKFLGKDRLFCFSIILPFAMITSLSELYFRFRRYILLVQTNKVTSMNYGSSTRSWKPWRWVRLELILSIKNTYITSNLKPVTKITSSSRSTEFKDILPWTIYQTIT